MRAVQITSLDGPGALTLADVAEPVAQGRVLIDVRAAGVSFPELLMTRGQYQLKPELPFVPGAEVAGVVRSGAGGIAEGDRVAAFPFLGGYAETVAVDPVMVFPLPDSMSFEAGAGLPMNYLTAHFVLTERGGLAKGQTVMVHGAAGGVGTACCQYAAALGARVIAVVSTEAKAEVARKAGAQDVVMADGFRDAVREVTEGRGVDLVVDPVGGDRFTDSLRSLAAGGSLLVVGFTAGEIPTVKVNRLLLSNTSVVGAAWGEHFMKDLPYLQRQWAALLPLIASGRLDPILGGSYPLERAGEALAELDERRVLGKLVLTT